MSTLPAVVDQGTDVATFNRELDAEVASSVNNDGYSREEAQRQYGYSDADMDRALAPPPSLASVQRQLAEIDRLRRTDRRAYDRDEALQQRERELISMREKLKVSAASAAKPGSEYDGADLPEELREEWSRQGGVAFHLRTAQETARAALDTLEPDEAADLQASFDTLPESARTSIFGFLAVAPGRWRAANEAELEVFRTSDIAEQLLEEWGAQQAAAKFGVARGRLNMMFNAMTPRDRERAEMWFGGLPAAQAMAVMRALAK